MKAFEIRTLGIEHIDGLNVVTHLKDVAVVLAKDKIALKMAVQKMGAYNDNTFLSGIDTPAIIFCMN